MSINEGKIVRQILELLYDPVFIEFEQQQETPTIFNVVGRTFTETWHSALFGWLLDPKSSHELNHFPLHRFILLLINQNTLSMKERGIDIEQLLSKGDFSKSVVRPNEREPSEISVKAIGRFDIFVDDILFEKWNKVQILVESKVKENINKKQCRKYMQYILIKRKENIFTLPVFLAPTHKLLGTSKDLFGHKAWIPIDYQSMYDEVIEPSLQHPNISPFGKFTLTEYVKTLKFYQDGGYPLVTTQKERDLVHMLMEKHESAIMAIFRILAESNQDFQLIPESNKKDYKIGVKLQIDDNIFPFDSVSQLYKEILKHLYKQGYLDNLELPFASGTKRYLLSKEPKHQTGRDFVKPIEYSGYFMETHKGRDTALRDLMKLLEVLKINPKIHEP